MAGQRLADEFVVQRQNIYDPDDWEDDESFDDENQAIRHSQSLFYPGGPKARVVRVRRKVVW